MKLNSFGFEDYKFILGPISEVFNMCITCDTAHVKSAQTKHDVPCLW